MSASLLIRELKKEDYCSIVPLLQQLSSFEVDEMMSPLKFELLVEYLSVTPNHRIYILEKEGKIIGCVTLIIEPKIIHSFGKILRVEDLVIDELHRGKGYGKYLLDLAKKTGKENGCYSISLTCNETNVEFYEKCDFYKKGEIEMRYSLL